MFHTIYDEATKTWSGPKTVPIFNPNVSAAQVILNALNNNPSKIGQISDNNGIQMKNSEIRKKTIRAAQHLHKMGFGKDDVIGIVARNHHHLAPIVFASIALAAPLNPMDPNFKADDLVHIMKVTKPKVIFCDKDNILKVQEALKKLDTNVPIFTFDRQVEVVRSVDELFIDTGANINHFVPIDIGDGTKHLLVILCSSGTTGQYKSVCVSHAAALEQLHKCLVMNAEDVLMDLNSLYSIAGFGILISAVMNGSTRVITTEVFQPELMLHIIEKYKVSITLTAPGHLALLLRSESLTSTKLSSLVKYFLGGSVVPQELCVRINQFLPTCIYVAYAMTELGGTISSNFPEPRAGSVGQLISGNTIKIIDDKGDQCGIGKDGEICYLPTFPFLGYYSDAKLTKAFVDSEGWLHSGDSGHFDEDGYLFVVDRLTEILTYRGAQISPSEIEEVILKHPGVTAVCVVGIPDAICTELPAAILMKGDAVVVTEQEVMDRVKNSMPDNSQLRGGVYIVDSLPMTPFGKIIRRKVKDMVIEMYNQRSRM